MTIASNANPVRASFHVTRSSPFRVGRWRLLDAWQTTPPGRVLLMCDGCGEQWCRADTRDTAADTPHEPRECFATWLYGTMAGRGKWWRVDDSRALMLDLGVPVVWTDPPPHPAMASDDWCMAPAWACDIAQAAERTSVHDELSRNADELEARCPGVCALIARLADDRAAQQMLRNHPEMARVLVNALRANGGRLAPPTNDDARKEPA